jgi:hypothetical protein
VRATPRARDDAAAPGAAQSARERLASCASLAERQLSGDVFHVVEYLRSRTICICSSRRDERAPRARHEQPAVRLVRGLHKI